MSDFNKRIAELSPEKRKLLFDRLKQKGRTTTYKAIPRRERKSNTFPLSFAQERIWFIEQLEPGSIIHNLPFAVRIEGFLEIDVLKRTLNEVVRRHETLRTVFPTKEGTPVQAVGEWQPFEMQVIDVGDISVAELDDKVDEMVAHEVNKPFDIVRGPLMRTTLFRRDDVTHAILFCLHHIIMDGASISVLLNDLVKIYEAFSTDQPSPLDELPIQYADYTMWQRELLQGDKLESELKYWKTKLAGIPRILELPTDRSRPAVQTFGGRNEIFELPVALSTAVKDLAKRAGVTVFMTMLAAFKVLLYRYTRHDKIVVGMPIANRDRSETQGLVGLFLNNLVLCTHFNDNPGFDQVLHRVRDTVLGAFEHQDMPFEKLVEEMQPDRDLSTSPLFQVMCIQLNAPTTEKTTSKLTLHRPRLQSNTMSKFDLTLYLDEWDGKLVCTFEHNTDLFDEQTMRRMGHHLEKILEQVVVQSDRRISNLSLLSDEEQQFLQNWNDTGFAYEREFCFHHLFERQASKNPNAIAIEYENQAITYAALNTRATLLASQLVSNGVCVNDLVAICAERSIDMVVGMIAIHKAGAAYVPIDPDYPKERVAFMLEDCQAKVLLTQKTLKSELPGFDGTLICLDEIEEEGGVQQFNVPVFSNSVAYVIYTSGSTGRPKGVAVSHGALVNFLTSMRQKPGLSAEDTLLAVTTLSFDIAALELFLPLTVGAKVIVANRETAADGRRLRDLLDSGGATVMQATPASWQLLLDANWRNESKIKILCGGEAFPRELANQLIATGSEVWNMYGPTETTIWSAVCAVDAGEDPVMIGPPIGNTQIFILDQGLQPVPTNVSGEVYIGGDGLAQGYLRRPNLTAERFIPNPFSDKPGSRLYRTGDLARFTSSGQLEFLGRIDHQVKVRGFRIELGEIESVLQKHAAVKAAVVSARELSPGDSRLVGYIVYTADEPTVSEMRKYLRQHLPDYMVPSLFVTMPEFPLTPNGKVDRKKLPLPGGFQGDASREPVPPSTDLEKEIAGLWKEVLGVNGFSIHDNFFEVGGHSLLSMRVIYQIEKKLGLNINPREIMFRSLGELAQLCEKQLQLKKERSSKGLGQKLLSSLKGAVAKPTT